MNDFKFIGLNQYFSRNAKTSMQLTDHFQRQKFAPFEYGNHLLLTAYIRDKSQRWKFLTFKMIKKGFDRVW